MHNKPNVVSIAPKIVYQDGVAGRMVVYRFNWPDPHEQRIWVSEKTLDEVSDEDEITNTADKVADVADTDDDVSVKNDEIIVADDKILSD